MEQHRRAGQMEGLRAQLKQERLDNQAYRKVFQDFLEEIGMDTEFFAYLRRSRGAA